MSADDRELVRRILERDDPEAKEELARRHQESVIRLVASVLGPARRQQVDDASQEAFLRAFRKLSSFRFDSAFSTWLHRVAYNTAIDFLRQPASRHERSCTEMPPVEDSAQGPLDHTLSRETRRRVAEALTRLPTPHRTSLLLHYWFESSVAEIGELLDVPEGTVKSYLSRGRTRLARFLRRSGEER